MRLIDADALKELFPDKGEGSWTYNITARMYIDNAPTVELDESIIQQVLNKRCMTAVANEYLIALHNNRPTAEWIAIKPSYPFPFECSHCGHQNSHKPKYCSNCGARMEGGI